jgi:ribosomal protein S18 acetylase RimI-like enzyme
MEDIFKITTAKSLEDAQQIAILAKDIWEEHYTPIIGVDQVKYMLNKFQSVSKVYEDISSSEYIYYVAYCGEGKMAGYCGIKSDKASEGIFLSKLYVNSNFRGMGLSKRFLNVIIEKAEAEGYDHIWLTVNKNNNNSIAAYKKMGFAVVEEMVSDIGNGFVMDDYKMRLELRK